MAVDGLRAREILSKILDLEELKTGTSVAKDVRRSVEELLTLEGNRKELFQELIYEIRLSFEEMFDSVKRRRSFTSKMDKLYPNFHEFSINKGYKMCSNFEKAVEMTMPEMLWQILMEKEFQELVKSQLLVSESSCSHASTPRVLSVIESNAVRYTAGHIIRKLEQKYSKRDTKEATECTASLRKMASKVRIEESEGQQHPSSSKWTNLVNRGGLLYVEDIVYDLFVTIECIVDEKLNDILKKGGKNIELVKKENLSWVRDNDEVQSLWSMVNPDSIEEESIHQNLLLEIVHLWTTTRGHSKTHKLKEQYKVQQKESTKGKRSLRKELAKS